MSTRDEFNSINTCETNFLHEVYVRQFNSTRRNYLSKHIHIFCRTLLKYLGLVSCVDLCTHIKDARAYADEQILSVVIDRAEHEKGLASDTITNNAPRWMSGSYAFFLWRLLFRLAEIKHSPFRRRIGYVWLSDVILFLYYAAVAHLLLNIYFQYALDLNLLRLRYFNEMKPDNVGAPTSKHTPTLDETQLRALISWADERLRAIGSPHSHMSFTVECLYLFTIAYSLIAFYITSLRTKLVVPFDVEIVRDLLDSENEQLSSNRRIERLIMDFVQSSEVYAKLVHSKNPIVGTCTRFSSWLRSENQADLERRIAYLKSFGFPWAHHKTTSTIAQMLTNGALQPFNKSTRWVEKRTKAMFISLLFIIFYVLFFFGGTIGVCLTAFRRETQQPYTWRDSLLTLSFLGPLFISVLSSSLYGTCYLIACYDQIVLVDQIRHLIEACIKRNEFEFYQLSLRLARSQKRSTSTTSTLLAVSSAPHARRVDVTSQWPFVDAAPGAKSSPPPSYRGTTRTDRRRMRFDKRSAVQCVTQVDIEHHIEKMNTNLLFVLLHYKLFVAQFYPVKRALESVIVFVSGLILILPLIIKIHLPYFNLIDNQQIKISAVVSSLFLVIPANINVTPVCHLYCRCVYLHRVLSSLAAHIVNVESRVGGIYDGHSTSILLKELHSPQQFMDQFKPQMIGISGTFTSWVKTHFWFGIIVLSILTDTKSDGPKLLSDIIADPLNVF